MKKIKAISNLLILLPVVGIQHMQYLLTRNSSQVKFTDYLMDKLKISYNKHSFFWLYLTLRSQYDLSELLNLWEIAKNNIEIKTNKLKFYATFFESAISERNKKVADQVLSHIDPNKNSYNKLATKLSTVFLDKDANKNRSDLGELPYPLYLPYLHPMLLGILNESNDNLDEAINNYSLALKKIPSNKLADSNWVRGRITDIENQKIANKIKIKKDLTGSESN